MNKEQEAVKKFNEAPTHEDKRNLVIESLTELGIGDCQNPVRNIKKEKYGGKETGILKKTISDLALEVASYLLSKRNIDLSLEETKEILIELIFYEMELVDLSELEENTPETILAQKQLRVEFERILKEIDKIKNDQEELLFSGIAEQIMMQIYFEDKSVKEIATALQKKEGRIRQIERDVLKRIRVMIITSPENFPLLSMKKEELKSNS